MADGDWQPLIDLLRGTTYRHGVITADSPVHRIDFAPGLTASEIDACQSSLGFRFPPDLRAFLQTALPCGDGFPDWRSADVSVLRDWLDEPKNGVLFDVEISGFWVASWGPRPQHMADALKLAADLLASAPRLIPVFAHRMIPDEPHSPGNPVLSVHQSDIISYGTDLTNYPCSEFDLPTARFPPAQRRAVRFWDQLIS